MSIDGRVDFELHIASPPRTIRAGGIDEADGKLIQIFQRAGDGLTGSKRNRDFRFRMLGIEHLLFEIEALVSRSDSRKIAGRGVTGCVSARTVEVLLDRKSVV